MTKSADLSDDKNETDGEDARVPEVAAGDENISVDDKVGSTDVNLASVGIGVGVGSINLSLGYEGTSVGANESVTADFEEFDETLEGMKMMTTLFSRMTQSWAICHSHSVDLYLRMMVDIPL